jgi:hypothetical protein
VHVVDDLVALFCMSARLTFAEPAVARSARSRANSLADLLAFAFMTVTGALRRGWRLRDGTALQQAGELAFGSVPDRRWR